MDKDIKVFDTLNKMMDDDDWWFKQKHSPIEFFAEAVARTRNEGETGISIRDIAKCFKAQFDETELESLISELSTEKIDNTISINELKENNI